MTRRMFDSTVAADIPAGSELVAGYIDGSHAWSNADWARFQDRRALVRIAIFNNRMDAQVLDVEPGNNDAISAVPWIRAKWLAGDVPTVYCFSDAGPIGYRISNIRDECDKAGVERPLIWVTDFDNNPGTFNPAGDREIIAKQYANAAQTGGHYDASVVADFWPGVDMTTPQRMGQSADLQLKPGELGNLEAIYSYPDTHPEGRTILVKVRGDRIGRRVIVVYPPTDPDADATMLIDAEPCLFVVDVLP